MTIPNPPTDSLYKYMAIGGIAIAFFSAYFLNDILTKKAEMKRSLKKEIKMLLFEFELKKIQADEDTVGMATLGRRLVDSEDDVAGMEEIVGYNTTLKYASIVFLAIGIVLSGLGFILWYTRLQKYEDMVVRDEANRHILEKSTRIHQIQFEKEFKIYSELWESLVELKEGLKGLNLRFFLEKNKDTFESEKVILQKEFDKLLGRCDSMYKNNKPFYSDEVYQLVSRFVPHILNEGGLLFMGRKGPDETLVAIGDIEVKIDEICVAIRKRIGTIEKA